MILTIIRLLVWMVVIPFLIGLIPLQILPQKRQTVIVTFISGYLLSFAVFELIAIPCMMNIEYGSFHYTTRIYAVTELLLAILGIIYSYAKIRREMRYAAPVMKNKFFSWQSMKDKMAIVFPGDCYAEAEDLLNPRSDVTIFRQHFSMETMIFWILFALIVLFQMYMAFTHASFDGDDAYYVTESLLAQQANVMNTILPYTGSSTSLDIRHALAVITMWIAFIAKAGGIHATILSHTVLPLLFIPLVYMVYMQIGLILFRKKKDMIPIFLIVISMIQMFGNTSIYTPETFFLTRTWQGKSLVSNLVIPLLIWLFLWISEEQQNSSKNGSGTAQIERISPWILMGMVNMTSGICSSMGVILGTILIGAYTVVMLISTRRISILFASFAACIPNLVYVLIYLSILR